MEIVYQKNKDKQDYIDNGSPKQQIIYIVHLCLQRNPCSEEVENSLFR